MAAAGSLITRFTICRLLWLHMLAQMLYGNSVFALNL